MIPVRYKPTPQMTVSRVPGGHSLQLKEIKKGRVIADPALLSRLEAAPTNGGSLRRRFAIILKATPYDSPGMG